MDSRVLVVEEDPVSQLMLQRLLRSDGYEVAVASDGPAALARLEGDGFDLGLLDVMLPGQGGLEVLQTLNS